MTLYSEWLNLFRVDVMLHKLFLFFFVSRHQRFPQMANFSKKIPTWQEGCR